MPESGIHDCSSWIGGKRHSRKALKRMRSQRSRERANLWSYLSDKISWGAVQSSVAFAAMMILPQIFWSRRTIWAATVADAVLTPQPRQG